MHVLNVLVGLVALTTSVSAAKFPNISPELRTAPKVCSQYSRQITLVKRNMDRPAEFCKYYLSRARTRTPMSGMSVDTLRKTCACYLLKSGRKIPRKATPGRVVQPPRGGFKCNTKYVSRIKNEFVNEAAFCKFFGAIPRDASPVAKLSAAQVVQGCKCILSPAKPVTTTKKKTTTKKTTTKKTTTTTTTTTAKVVTTTTSAGPAVTTTSSALTTTTTEDIEEPEPTPDTTTSETEEEPTPEPSTSEETFEEESTTTSVVQATTTSTEEPLTTEATTTEAPEPTTSTTTSFTCPSVQASVTFSTSTWTAIFVGSSTAVTTVSTLTTTKYTSTLDYVAAATACAEVAFDIGGSNANQYNLQYIPANSNAWNCVVYQDQFYSGGVNYAGIDNSIECSYGYEEAPPI